MSLNLNIDNFGSHSVVPITCNDVQGTGFYIGNNHLLTAYHVVSDFEYDGSPIIAVIDNKEVICELIKLGEMDVALLKTLDAIDDDIISKIPLLDSDFKKGLDLQIIGYPQEIGNGVDFFGVSVCNHQKVVDRNFDVIVRRTDSFGFYSYSGFSGAPVLNEFGYAVGVVTDQFHNSLGYTSIKSISSELERRGVEISKNPDEFDTRPFGLGTCIKAAKESVSRAKSRYVKNRHVEDDELENYLKYFCGLEVSEAQMRLLDGFKEWYVRLPKDYRDFCDRQVAFSTYLQTGEMSSEFYYALGTIANEPDPEYPESTLIKGNYISELNRLIDELQVVQDIKVLAETRWVFISADAGFGKTHHLCHIVSKLSKLANVYLFFGIDFNGAADPVRTIADILRWDSTDYLRRLNEEMKSKDRYATFIIDALNEGEGTYYWHDRLPQLQSTIEQYDRLKLIVSVRTMETDDSLREILKSPMWHEYKLRGFSDLRKAIERYFDVYEIYEPTEKYLQYNELHRPLFLKIFCETYYGLLPQYRSDIDILMLYRCYFHKRNEEVSRYADEDPQRDVASKLIYSIGERSLQTYNCTDIPRSKAIGVANKICRGRLWSNNLYHSAIKANLLMEYNTRFGECKTMFEYDSMGDYVRATNIMTLNKTDEERLAHLQRLVAKITRTDIDPKERKQIKNTIRAFLSVWNPDESFWTKPEFNSRELKAILIDSLADRNIQSKSSSLKPHVVKALLIADDNMLNIERILNQFQIYRDQLMPYLHEKLMSMSMLARDEIWTIGVNQLLDNHRLTHILNNVELESESDYKTYIWILIWMMSTSHPSMRGYLMRIVRELLSDHTELCLAFIDLFHSVNDSNILYGLYGAIYGVLLVNRDCNLADSTAEKIFAYHYKDQINVPSEISVRSWTLKILEFAYYLNPKSSYWLASQPPYKPTLNLMEVPEAEEFKNQEYFGKGVGASYLYQSLFKIDFNLYIIGKNSDSESRIFINQGKRILLDDITNAIAYRIKSAYGYSNTLSDYDKNVRREERHYHSKERIGKKYQWMALGEVNAFLCDTCTVIKNTFTDDVASVPYPWYADPSSNFDPTLKIYDNQLTQDNDLFEYLPNVDLFDSYNPDWINSSDNISDKNIVIKDKTGDEWVLLTGYQKYKQEFAGETRETFVFYNSCLVQDKEDSIRKFEEWARSQNFYGRWMPENTGDYKYLWNEYPWSERSKQYDREEISIYRNSAPCKIILPYSAQLQEDRVSIEDEKFINTTVYMPLVEFYEMFGLHNAERGVVRDNKGNTIAIHRDVPGDALDGLVVRRDYLNQFLSKKNLVLFYCNLAEKQVWKDLTLINVARYSSCSEYQEVGDIKILQPITNIKGFPNNNY